MATLQRIGEKRYISEPVEPGFYRHAQLDGAALEVAETETLVRVEVFEYEYEHRKENPNWYLRGYLTVAEYATQQDSERARQEEAHARWLAASEASLACRRKAAEKLARKRKRWYRRMWAKIWKANGADVNSVPEARVVKE